MQHRITLLLFLMSSSLVAMQEGAWDEYGNYLGPTIQPTQQPYIPDPHLANVQVMMMPQLVYMPMIMTPYGPQPYMQPMMQQPMHHMPFFNTVNQQPQPVQPQHISSTSGEWAAQAPLPQSQPVQEQSAPAIESVPAVDTHQDVRVEYEQVTEITDRVKNLALSEETPVVQAANSTHWADVLDSDSPSPSPQSFQSSVNDEDSVPLQSSSSSSSTSDIAPIEQIKPIKKPISYLQAAVQKRDVAPVHDHQSIAASATHSSSSMQKKQSLNDKIAVALASLDDANAVKRLHQLTQNKFDAISKSNQVHRLREWDMLARLYEQSPAFACVAIQPEHATALMYLAGTLVENAKKMEQLAARKTFGRLALRCIESATEKIPAQFVHRVSSITEQAKALLAKKRAVDQTDVPEEQFYEGHVSAVVETQIRSDGKVLGAVVLPTPVSAKNTQQAANVVQPVKTPEVKKNLPQQKVSPKTHAKQKKKIAAPNPVATVIQTESPIVQKELEQPSYQERVKRLLNGSRAEIKEGFSLLEQASEGKMPDVDHAFQIEAMRALGSYYFHGYSDKIDSAVVIKPNPKRAIYFLDKAVAAGDVEALADILPLVFEHDRQKLSAYIDRLETHPHAEEMIKQCGRIYRAAARLMDDEQGQLLETVTVFKQFLQVYDRVAFSEPMTALADVLPISFYTWIRGRIPHWQKDLKARNSEQKKSVPYAEIDPCVELLYLMGRFHLEGDAQRFGTFGYQAIEWIKAAADGGNFQAELYLATPRSNPQHQLCVFDRIRYLRRSLYKTENRTVAASDHAVGLCESYAVQGFFDPLIDCLWMWHTCDKLDDALRKLEGHFPAIRILGGDTGSFLLAQESGLLDALKERATDSWVARGILSALEISRYRDYMQASPAMITEIDNARERIQEDVKTHPQLEAVVAACYSTRAFVIKRITSEVSYASIDQGIELTKRAAHDYEESVKRGDLFGKVSYGMLLLNVNPNLIGNAAGTQDLRKKGLALLQEIADGKDEEYKLSVLEHLVNHFTDEYNWDMVDEYLEKAREWAKSIHRDDRVQALADLEKKIRAIRNKNPKLSRSEVLRRQEREKLLVAKQETDRKNGELIARLKKADEYVYTAAQEARTNPFAALRNLRLMDMPGIQSQLRRNPRMIALCYMALDDISMAASDERLVKPQAKEQLLKAIEPFHHSMGQASLAYQELCSKSDYTWKKFEQLIKRYLDTYHLKVRVMRVIQTTPVEQLHEALGKVIPASYNMMDRLNRVSIERLAQAAYTQIEIALQEAREAYQNAAAGEATALAETLKKL